MDFEPTCQTFREDRRGKPARRSIGSRHRRRGGLAAADGILVSSGGPRRTEHAIGVVPRVQTAAGRHRRVMTGRHVGHRIEAARGRSEARSRTARAGAVGTARPAGRLGVWAWPRMLGGGAHSAAIPRHGRERGPHRGDEQDGGQQRRHEAHHRRTPFCLRKPQHPNRRKTPSRLSTGTKIQGRRESRRVHFIVGMTNSAPPRIPVGQREVTVLSAV